MKKKSAYLLVYVEKKGKKVYVLKHIGHYTTYEKAKKDERKYKKKKAFRKKPKNFIIKKIDFDKTHKIRFFKGNYEHV